MKLRLLGTTGYHPNDRRQTACVMLPEIGVVLDAGTAMYRVRDHLETDNLDIFLTHAHLDHVVGLTYLFSILHDRDGVVVRVHGEAEKLDAVANHLFAQLIFPVQPPLTWQPLTGPVAMSSGILSWFPLKHPGGSVGYRIDWPDRAMAYVTDTTADPAAEYVEKIRGVDLLIHECYFPDGWEELARKTGHSCATPVAEVARAAGVGQLVLVHTTPLSTGDDPVGLAAMRQIFPPTTLGEDGMLLEF